MTRRPRRTPSRKPRPRSIKGRTHSKTVAGLVKDDNYDRRLRAIGTGAVNRAQKSRADIVRGLVVRDLSGWL